jgi:hypothetical protein
LYYIQRQRNDFPLVWGTVNWAGQVEKVQDLGVLCILSALSRGTSRFGLELFNERGRFGLNLVSLGLWLCCLVLVWSGMVGMRWAELIGAIWPLLRYGRWRGWGVWCSGGMNFWRRFGRCCAVLCYAGCGGLGWNRLGCVVVGVISWNGGK